MPLLNVEQSDENGAGRSALPDRPVLDSGSLLRSISLNQAGFVFGGGLEHALSDQIFIGFEAQHYVFGKQFDARSLTPDSDLGDFAKLKGISVARIGVSYKFNSN
ncbi:MAG: opacity protein-like surface antigen [Hyphomicrobiaceae bacterium]|jgi:opacity protein-like surface antigen